MQSSICVTAVNPLPPPETFVGRQPDIDAVKGLIASSAVSLVCGREGMGKTALCKRVFYEIGQQNELGVKAVGWLDYFESVEYTLYGQFPNIKPSPDIFAYARAAEEYLKGFGSDLALFVDNVDIEAMGFPAILAFLSGLGCRVVFLSGNRIRQVPSHYVERLPLADQEGVFRA
jgi:hypothetical protein